MQLIENILKEYYKSGKEELIFINIGTDKCIFDAFGPLLGQELKEKTSLSVYGTLEFPIHAVNMKQRLSKVYKKHPDAFIVATDACFTTVESDFNTVRIKSGKLKPGAGVGKSLEPIGDMKIEFLVNKATFTKSLAENMRLFTVIKAVGQVVNMLEGLDSILKLDKLKVV